MPPSLSEKMQALQNEIEGKNANTLKELHESLRSELQIEHEATMNVIRAQQQGLRTALRPVLWTTLFCLVIVAVALSLLWAGTWWKQRELLALMAEIKVQEQTLAVLQDKTGGIKIMKAQNGIFAILPEKIDTQWWECGDPKQPCLKLKD